MLCVDPNHKNKSKLEKNFCHTCYKNERRKSDPEWRSQENLRSYRTTLKRRYGITPEDRQVLLETQDHLCASCGYFSEQLVIDHDHKTDEVRGLLCQACNVALGLMKEDSERLTALICYLEKHKR